MPGEFAERLWSVGDGLVEIFRQPCGRHIVIVRHGVMRHGRRLLREHGSGETQRCDCRAEENRIESKQWHSHGVLAFFNSR